MDIKNILDEILIRTKSMINSGYLQCMDISITKSKNDNLYSITIYSPSTYWRNNKTEKSIAKIKFGKSQYLIFNKTYKKQLLKYHLPFEEASTELRISIDDYMNFETNSLCCAINDILISLFSISPFGCCGKFSECDQKGYCVHSDQIYATGCQHKKFINANK